MNWRIAGVRFTLLLAVGMQVGCMGSSRRPPDTVPLHKLASQLAAEACRCPLIIVGESSHGVDEFGRFRLELIRELHRIGHARLILLESPFAGSFGISPLDTTRTPTEYLNSTTYSVWHTSAYRDLVQYVREQAARGDTIHLLCIDPNLLSPAVRRPISHLLGSTFGVVSDSNQVLAKLLPILDELHSLEVDGEHARGSTARARMLIQAGRDHLTVPSRREVSDSVRVGIAVARAILDGFEMWASAARDSTPASAMLLRDRRMARLVELARKDLYPNAAAVLLTHNWHARRNADRVTVENVPGVHGITDDLYVHGGTSEGEFVSLGGRLTQIHPESTFVVGLYFGKGTVALNDRSTAVIPAARTGSLERRVLDRYPGGGIVNFNHSGIVLPKPWWRTEQSARYWGLWEERFVPSEQYDCVVVVPQATLPSYTD